MAEPLLLAHVKLHGPQLVILQEVRRRGGKMSWRWDNPQVQPVVYDMAADLVHRKILDFVEEVSDARQVSGPTFVRLTDLGNRLLDSYERQQTASHALETGGGGGAPHDSSNS